MPTARIITRFPDRAASLRKTLTDSGYKVQIVAPDQKVSGLADIEYDLDAMNEFAPQASAVVSSVPPSPSPERIAKELAAQREAEAKERERIAYEAQVKQRQLKGEAERKAVAAQEWEKAARELREKRQREAERQAQIMAQMQEQRRVEAERQQQARIESQREAQRLAAIRAEEKHKADEAARIASRAAVERRRQQINATIARAKESSSAAWTRASETTFRFADQGKTWWQQNAPEYRHRIATSARTAVAWITRQRQSAGEKWSAARPHIAQSLRDWSKIAPAQSFSNTRDYAFRQAAPVAAAVAAVFVLGWALAVGNSERAQSREAVMVAPSSLAVTPAVTATPVAATLPIETPAARPAIVQKPSPAKSTVRRSRRLAPQTHESSAQDDEPEVVIVHHRRSAQRPTVRDKEGLKVISDLE